MPRLSGLSANEAAFLDMIAHSEGTAGISDDGYDVLVGGSLFNGYADHPRQLIHINARLASTAAGRYQILERTFDAYKRTLGLQDFSPEAQDRIAIELVAERGARSALNKNEVNAAIILCSNIWASLPGNTYGQHQNGLAALRDIYVRAGGEIA